MKLRFSNLDDVYDYIEQIEIENHTPTKNWTAAQNFFHLASALEGSMNQLPSGYPWLIRLAARSFRWIVTRYRFPPWLPIPAAIKDKLTPPKTAEFVEQKHRLLKTITRFSEFTNGYASHPVLGDLDPDEWVGFHLRHCEHHLSFIKLNTRSRTEKNVG